MTETANKYLDKQGVRRDFFLKVMGIRGPFSGNYGEYVIYHMTDRHGNHAHISCSYSNGKDILNLQDGDCAKIKATVKELRPYTNGQRNTTFLNRAKLIENYGKKESQDGNS